MHHLPLPHTFAIFEVRAVVAALLVPLQHLHTVNRLSKSQPSCAPLICHSNNSSSSVCCVLIQHWTITVTSLHVHLRLSPAGWRHPCC
jgi:hypothetical protein